MVILERSRRKSAPETLPGVVRDQLGALSGVRHRYGVPLETIKEESPKEFAPISTSWADPGERVGLMKRAKAKSENEITPFFSVSNESFWKETVDKIREVSTGTESMMGIAGGGTMLLRILSEAQKVSPGLKAAKAVDTNPVALLHLENMANSYNKHPHIPVYYVEGPEYGYMERMAEMQIEGEPIVSSKTPMYSPEYAGGMNFVETYINGERKALVEIRKWEYNENTEITLTRNDLLREVRECLRGRKPRKTLFYFSNVPYLPLESWCSQNGCMPVISSQHLLHVIQGQECFANGSAVIMYHNITSMTILRKENDRLVSVYSAADDPQCLYKVAWVPKPKIHHAIKPEPKDQMKASVELYGGIFSKVKY